MGLLLLIPGLVFLVNGTEWFSGENAVGRALVIVGGILLAVQAAVTILVAAKVRKDINDFRH